MFFISLHFVMSSSRRSIYFSDTARKDLHFGADNNLIHAFHRGLPNYAPTPLISLPGIANEIGVRGVYVKDESSRFGLPSFKVLGASWGVFRALLNRLDLPSDTELEELSTAAKKLPIKLFAATDGNHGRAVAFMARLLSLEACILVPDILDEYTRNMIVGEGAEVHAVTGDYDFTVQKAAEMAGATHGGLLIQDTAFAGYEAIPSWIVEGYSTMLSEIDQQLQSIGLDSTIMITPVGVGSLAHAVAKHCKSAPRPASVVTVEPDTAACLHESLRAGSVVSLSTSHTIMTGMNCGTVSLTAWNDLRRLVDVSTTISCFESHCAVQYLSQHKIYAGPCGAASLASLKLLASTKHATFKLDETDVIVLLSTEGDRPYQTPPDVSSDDPIILTEILNTISFQASPICETPGTERTSTKETANYILAWFAHRGIKTDLVEIAPTNALEIRVVQEEGLTTALMIPRQYNEKVGNVNASLANTMLSTIMQRAT